MVNPRDIAGNAEEEDKELGRDVQQAHQHANTSCHFHTTSLGSVCVSKIFALTPTILYHYHWSWL